jgi:hypothetical protein
MVRPAPFPVAPPLPPSRQPRALAPTTVHPPLLPAPRLTPETEAAALKASSASPASFPNAVQARSAAVPGAPEGEIVDIREDGSVDSILIDHNGAPLVGCVPAEVARLAGAGDVAALDKLNADLQAEMPEGAIWGSRGRWGDVMVNVADRGCGGELRPATP